MSKEKKSHLPLLFIYLSMSLPLSPQRANKKFLKGRFGLSLETAEVNLNFKDNMVYMCVGISNHPSSAGSKN